MKKKIQYVINHPLFSGSAIMIGGSLSANVINYLYHLIMGRMLGPVNYGILSSLYALLYVVSVIPLSSSLAIIKFISSAKNSQQQAILYYNIRSLILRIAIVGAIIILLISPLISRFLHISDLFSVLLIAPIFFFSLVTLMNQATAQALLNFFASVVPTLVSSVTKLLLGVALVAIGFLVGGAMFGVLLSAILGYLFSLNIGKKFRKEVKQKYNLKPFFKYSAPVLLQAMAFTSIMSTDVILVKHFFPENSAGYYAALSTLGKIIFFAAQPVTGAMFPIISRKITSGERYVHIFLMSLGLTILAAGFVVMVYFLVPNTAISLTFGNSYASASNELVWMGLFFAFYSISNLLVNFFLSVDKTEIVLLPLIVSITQIGAIWLWHANLLQVIQISLTLMIVLSSSLLLYFAKLQRKSLQY